MKNISCLLCTLFLVLAGCGCPGNTTPPETPAPVTAISAEHAAKLAEKFCPALYLCRDTDAVEYYEPEPIEIMLDAASLLAIEDPSFSEKATTLTLSQWSQSSYYLDLLGLGPTTSSPDEYRLNYDSVKGSYRPTVYARVKEREGNGYTVLQYWIFYFLNDWRNLHEGDWELVQLCFPPLTSREIIENEELPLFAAYSQHQTGQQMSWTDMQAQELVNDNHPVVYVALGSHANYFTPGNSWSGLDFDKTGITNWHIINPQELEVIMLPETEPAPAADEELGWLHFRGYWGEYTGFSISVLDLKFWQHGPFGPPWSNQEWESDKWQNPDEWAGSLPEYPEPFWKAFLDIPGDWFDQAFFCLFSPAELHVYDAWGRHVGMNDRGQLEIQIPEAVYIQPTGTQYKTIIIPYADISQQYQVVLEGTDSGGMDIKIQVPDARQQAKQYLEYTGVPVTDATTARISILPDKISSLKLDTDSDGVFEAESLPGSFEKNRVELSAPQVLTVALDIEPDRLLLTGVNREESVQAYIELPAAYSPREINISSIRLLKNIPALEKQSAIVDHNQNGIPELMVSFDLNLVVSHLISQGFTAGNIRVTLYGHTGNMRFQGTDSIQIVSNVTGSE